MSVSGLQSFLDGTNPHAATRAKVVAWYATPKHGTSRPFGADADVAKQLLAAYVAGASGRAKTRRAADAIEAVLRELTETERLAVIQVAKRAR
jgi:hypothetical protein